MTSLAAVQKDLNTLKALKNPTNTTEQHTLLTVGSDAYCQLATLTYSRQQIIKLVGGTGASLIHQYTDQPFGKLNKAFSEFQRLDVGPAILQVQVKGFADDMNKLLDEIKQKSNMLKPVIKSSGSDSLTNIIDTLTQSGL